MSTPVGRRSNLLLITLLLVLSILLEQFFIAPIFPWLGNLGAIRPMIVFLDIPLELPAIDLVPVSVLFALFYQIAPSAGLTHEQPSVSSGMRIWKALTGWWTLLALLLAGGGLFFLARNYLPRSVSNGIDSFGVRADLTLPYPSGDRIHLHGSVAMLLTSALGVLFLNRRTATTAPAQQPQATGIPIPVPIPQPLSSTVVSSTGTLITPPPPPEKRYKPVTILPGQNKPVNTVSKPAIITPEPPPTCRLTTPPPIAVVMPRPAPGIGKMHPCYVTGSLNPSKVDPMVRETAPFIA